jgi:hypothetical protein
MRIGVEREKERERERDRERGRERDSGISLKREGYYPIQIEERKKTQCKANEQ